MKSLVLAAVALGLAALPFFGCDESMTCTAAACGPTLHISIAPVDKGDLPDATYDVVLELDGTTYSTTCRLEDPGVSCDPVAGPATFDVEMGDSYLTTQLGLEVSADNGEGDGPASVHLTVVADDAVLVDTPLEPVYSVGFPNGEECGPRCVTAEWIEVTFDRP